MCRFKSYIFYSLYSSIRAYKNNINREPFPAVNKTYRPLYTTIDYKYFITNTVLILNAYNILML